MENDIENLNESLTLARLFEKIGYYKRSLICYEKALDYIERGEVKNQQLMDQCLDSIIELHAKIETNKQTLKKFVLLKK
ncbi:Adho113-like protein [Cryptophlebia peltastica nucleopolyhedrovirus]|uniref:Adho113-like protein n=1 Tax=Cryptophlebia peltastica nucleopolyhedrovirus TaxID=2304025 RepID=A0A346RNY5_9ABAC|nr:Adho113-like protein [Cryptophlebia peltastica nucleopolyhedrovirus]AXS67782.1 Adho113-like protein [Cryptophlebia peltastica nucleopolyhedrovirus]